jgi:transcriptional regulator with XRE-family HTH domain
MDEPEKEGENPSKLMKPVGDRLREERIRLEKSVGDMAQSAGLHRNSYSRHEAGDWPGSIAMLMVYSELGVDIGYVLSGKRGDGSLGGVETMFFNLLAKLSQREKRAVLAMMTALVGEAVDLDDPMPPKGPTLHDQKLGFKAKGLD